MHSKCHLTKGTAANGSFTLYGFNYLNEVHSKKCTLGFFCSLQLCFIVVFSVIFKNKKTLHFSLYFSILIEINFPGCFIFENTWNRAIISKR